MQLTTIFICGAIRDGNPCVSRHHCHPERSRARVTPNMPDEELLDLLNKIYGYAHAGGYELGESGSRPHHEGK